VRHFVYAIRLIQLLAPFDNTTEVETLPTTFWPMGFTAARIGNGGEGDGPVLNTHTSRLYSHRMESEHSITELRAMLKAVREAIETLEASLPKTANKRKRIKEARAQELVILGRLAAQGVEI
jgi:hypothetical protein